ncbi:MAG: DUF481 domain-containing protein [Desulfuromonadaceae bacterium]
MLFKKLLVIACVGSLLGLVPLSVLADEIVIDNGVVIKGTVTGLAEGIVSVSSDYAEPIKIKAGKITGITTTSPVEIRMKNGEVLKGSLKTDAHGVLTVEQVVGRGSVAVDLNNIAAINPPPVNTWKGTVVVAGNYQTGNTERSALRLSGDAVRKSDKERFSMNFIYDLAEEDKALTSRSVYGALKYDYFFTNKFYGYLGVELLSDRYKDINLRTVVGPGVGYQIWDEQRKALAVEAGIAYFSEDLKTGNDNSWATARLAGNYMYKITKAITFTDSLILYSSLEKASAFKLRNEAAIATALGAGWSMKLANVLDYDNEPAADIKKTDSVLLLGLQYAF